MGGCDAEYTSVWKIWPSTATEMLSDASRKLCISDLKEMSAYLREDGEIYALDRVCGGTRSKPLPNVLPRFLSSKSYYVHAERKASTANRRTTSRFGRRLRSQRYTPVEGDAAILRTERSGDKYRGAESYVPRPKCKCRSAVASNGCSRAVRSIRPRTASIVHPTTTRQKSKTC